MDEELIGGMKTLKPKAKQENDEMRIAGGKTVRAWLGRNFDFELLASIISENSLMFC